MIRSTLINDRTWSILMNGPYTKRYKFLLEQPYGKTLEIGPGQGVMTIQMLEKGIDVVGIDNDPDCIAAAKDMFRLNGVDTTIHLGDVNKMPFADKIFDTVVCSEVLEHLYTPFEALKEMVRVCSGNIYVSVPTQGVMPPSKTEGHIQDFNSETLILFMEALNLEVTYSRVDKIFTYIFGRVL